MEEHIANSPTHCFLRASRDPEGAGLPARNLRAMPVTGQEGTAEILQEEAARSANEEPWHAHRREGPGGNAADCASSSRSRS